MKWICLEHGDGTRTFVRSADIRSVQVLRDYSYVSVWDGTNYRALSVPSNGLAKFLAKVEEAENASLARAVP